MSADTRAAGLDIPGSRQSWDGFRVVDSRARMGLLRQLRDAAVPVILNTSDGEALTTALWALDVDQQRLNFSVGANDPRLGSVIEAEEVVAVAYLESVKLQFDLLDPVLVHAAQGCTLQCAAPREVYRFQRRSGYRVRTAPARHAPTARLRHPAIPDMSLALRVLDISIGGCALWLPHDVPPLQAGTRLAEVQVELDAQTRFGAGLQLMHVTVLSHNERGARLGCEWRALSGAAQRSLQLWIDQSQKCSRLLSAS